MIPDGEAILIAHLAADDAVTAVTTRIGTQTPGGHDAPWVKVTQLDARNSPQSSFEHLIDFLFQIDCYAGKAGGTIQSSLLGRSVRAAVVAMTETIFADVVVTSARILSDPNLPDRVFEPARDRRALTVSIYMHPR